MTYLDVQAPFLKKKHLMRENEQKRKRETYCVYFIFEVNIRILNLDRSFDGFIFMNLYYFGGLIYSTIAFLNIKNLTKQNVRYK